MDLDGLDLPADADVYLCGSVPFMRAVRTRLLQAGVPARSIRYEVFAPTCGSPTRKAESCSDSEMGRRPRGRAAARRQWPACRYVRVLRLAPRLRRARPLPVRRP
jgi:nitric oxide dioxygenase